MGRLNLKSWLGQLPKTLSSHDANPDRTYRRRSTNLTINPYRQSKNHGISSTSIQVDAGGQVRASMAIADTSMSTLTQLAEKILGETKNLETYCQTNGLQLPSFDDATSLDPHKLPDHVNKSRLEIIDSAKKLRDLSVGPEERIRWAVWDVCGRSPSMSTVQDVESCTDSLATPSVSGRACTADHQSL
jgi:hypothetical protein